MITLNNKCKDMIVVFGDFMLDRYIHGDATRISPEAPVPIVLMKNIEYIPGGAGNVFKQILELESNATLISMADMDSSGYIIHNIFDNYSNADLKIVHTHRPTTIKTRIMAHGRQMLRIDEECTGELNDIELGRLIKSIDSIITNDVSVVIISDYKKGICNTKLVSFIISLCNMYNIPVIIDTKSDIIGKYTGATIITPNSHEYSLLLKNYTEEELLNKYFEYIIVTQGNKGVRFVDKNSSCIIDSTARNVFDVTGAGDVFAATLAVALSRLHSVLESTIIANVAAGLSVEQIGTTSVNFQDLQKRLNANSLAELKEINKAVSRTRTICTR